MFDDSPSQQPQNQGGSFKAKMDLIQDEETKGRLWKLHEMGFKDFEKCLDAVRKANELKGQYQPLDFLID